MNDTEHIFMLFEQCTSQCNALAVTMHTQKLCQEGDHC